MDPHALHRQRLQQGMRAAALDALLLSGEAAGRFAAGHARIGVQLPGGPMPVTVLPASGLPHVVTADPDGAAHLPEDHVHGLMWNPASLLSALPRWLGRGSGLRLGADALSPAGLSLVRAALPGSEILDANPLIAEAMLVKSEAEIEALAALARFIGTAARAGLAGGRGGLLRALAGAFPVSFPQVSERRVAVAVRRDGWIGEARIGPGDARIGRRALESLQPGIAAADAAAGLPPGVEAVGIGWGYEAPVLRRGVGSPPGLVLRSGAVLALRWQACGVTVALADAGPRLLSPAPEEVAR